MELSGKAHSILAKPWVPPPALRLRRLVSSGTPQETGTDAAKPSPNQLSLVVPVSESRWEEA